MAFAGAGGLATYNKAQYDSYVGGLISSYWQIVANIAAVKAFNDAHNDTEFQAAPGPGVFGPVGYDTAINTLKGAVNEIAELGVIGRGEQSQSAIRLNTNAHDYRVTCRLVSPPSANF